MTIPSSMAAGQRRGGRLIVCCVLSLLTGLCLMVLLSILSYVLHVFLFLLV